MKTKDYIWRGINIDNKPDICGQFKIQTGLKIAADTPDDTVHGYIVSVSKKANFKTGRFVTGPNTIIISKCNNCNSPINQQSAHHCFKVCFYTENELPNQDHSTTFQSLPNPDQHAKDLEDILKA